MKNKESNIIRNVDYDTEKRVLRHFYTCLEQVIRNNNLMRYNSPANSLYDVYKLVRDMTSTMMIPDDLQSVDDLQEYNMIEEKHDILILAYVQEHFDKVQG